MKALPAAAFAALSVYECLVRPWMLRWGATGEECGADLPGDEGSAVETSATRALTIQAPVELVWAWLIQLGQDRGGFYSYTALENLFLADMVNADRLHGEWQHRQPGDNVWMAPPSRYGGTGRMVVSEVDAPRTLVLVTPEDWTRKQRGERILEGAWSFHLFALSRGATRMLVRSRGPSNLFRRYVFDPAHFLMERRMMLGIRERAEA
ncbi:MAG: hypothetical protein K2X35_23865 [Bryobacteraceae bacterium]|nr:hypothetical protein [Bryobacteraceae bacterium]